MASHDTGLRYASPNEQRTISRENAGFYHALIVGAIYEFESKIDVRAPETFYCPLQRCIEEHPYLAVVVMDSDTDKAYFQPMLSIELKAHISIIGELDTRDEFTKIEELVVSNLDTPFAGGIPPWRIIVLPLQNTCFIAFCYSHTIGDGPTGAAFHRTFLHAFNRNVDNAIRTSDVIEVPTRKLPAPFDTPQRLPISWSFLLSPLISLFLPSAASKLLGLRTSASNIDKGTWTGSNIFFDPETHHSKVKLREVDDLTVEKAIHASRKHNTKLTGVLLEMISRALNNAILDSNVTNFVSQTAVNMRTSIGIPNHEAGEYATACYILHPRRDLDKALNWTAASSSTRTLAQTASTLQDQAIGLLRYLPSIRKWTLSKIGQVRDGSFEVSNIGAFDGKGCDDRAKITKMLFAQPGHVIGVPLTFNFVSVKGSSLVYTVTWQAGALGLTDQDEESFVEKVCVSVEQDLSNID